MHAPPAVRDGTLPTRTTDTQKSSHRNHQAQRNKHLHRESKQPVCLRTWIGVVTLRLSSGLFSYQNSRLGGKREPTTRPLSQQAGRLAEGGGGVSRYHDTADKRVRDLSWKRSQQTHKANEPTGQACRAHAHAASCNRYNPGVAPPSEAEAARQSSAGAVISAAASISARGRRGAARLQEQRTNQRRRSELKGVSAASTQVMTAEPGAPPPPQSPESTQYWLHCCLRCRSHHRSPRRSQNAAANEADCFWD